MPHCFRWHCTTLDWCEWPTFSESCWGVRQPPYALQPNCPGEEAKAKHWGPNPDSPPGLLGSQHWLCQQSCPSPAGSGARPL